MGERICSGPDCKTPARSRGMCNAHYLAARKRGAFTPRAKVTPPQAKPGEPVCTVKKCGRHRFCRGLCARHYGAAWRRGDFTVAQLELPFDRHSLTNIDSETRVADCSICGPGVRIRVRARRHPSCIVVDQGKRRYQLQPDQRRHRKLREKYKLSLAEYNQMLDAQGNVCAICLEPRPYKLFVDHCHKTGRVRGLLCAPCNTGLGMLRDDPDRAMRASGYLTS